MTLPTSGLIQIGAGTTQLSAPLVLTGNATIVGAGTAITKLTGAGIVAPAGSILAVRDLSLSGTAGEGIRHSGGAAGNLYLTNVTISGFDTAVVHDHGDGVAWFNGCDLSANWGPLLSWSANFRGKRLLLEDCHIHDGGRVGSNLDHLIYIHPNISLGVYRTRLGNLRSTGYLVQMFSSSDVPASQSPDYVVFEDVQTYGTCDGGVRTNPNVYPAGVTRFVRCVFGHDGTPIKDAGHFKTQDCSYTGKNGGWLWSRAS